MLAQRLRSDCCVVVVALPPPFPLRRPSLPLPSRVMSSSSVLSVLMTFHRWSSSARTPPHWVLRGCSWGTHCRWRGTPLQQRIITLAPEMAEMPLRLDEITSSYFCSLFRLNKTWCYILLLWSSPFSRIEQVVNIMQQMIYCIMSACHKDSRHTTV